jgi:hypothetical protein
MELNQALVAKKLDALGDFLAQPELEVRSLIKPATGANISAALCNITWMWRSWRPGPVVGLSGRWHRLS